LKRAVIVLCVLLFFCSLGLAQTPDTITGGKFQFPDGTACAGCTLYLTLSQDAAVAGTGQVMHGGSPRAYTLDANGNVPSGSTLWGNDQLTAPQQTYYIASVNYPGGGQLLGPEAWEVVGTSPVSLTGMLPIVPSPISFPSPVLQNTTTAQSVMGNFTVGGALTANGPLTANNMVNGVCMVTATQSLSACVTAVGISGTIEVTPVAGTISGTGITIPAGVTLRVDENALISGTPTINGPLVAGPYQIFTGTPTFGAGTASVRAVWFPGADILAQLSNAYAAGPAAPSDFIIYGDPNPAGGCWSASSSAHLNTVNKYATVQGPGSGTANNDQGGFCINFTPTGGTAYSISSTSVSSSVMTVNCSATCTTGWTGGGAPNGTLVMMLGITNPDENGVYFVQAVNSGTQFTVNTNIGAPAGSSGGTVAQAVYAIEADWTPTTGGGYATGGGFRDLTINNNNCFTNGGCGNATIGILSARTNGGMHAAEIWNVRITGFGANVSKPQTPYQQTGWGIVYDNCSCAWSNVCLNVMTANENDTWRNGRVAVNGTGFQLNAYGAELTVHGGSLDSNTIAGANLANGAILHTGDLHWENFGLTGAMVPYVVSSGSGSLLDFDGGIAYDDVSSGSSSVLWFNAGYIVGKVTISSLGRTYSGAIFGGNTRAKITFLNENPAYITSPCYTGQWCEDARNLQFAVNGGYVTSTGAGGTMASVVYQPSVAGNGVSAIIADTSQKSETGADTNVLTLTPPSTVGTYRLSFSISLSAASSATLGWTATWTDANGTAQAPTNLPICISSAGTCGATTGALSTTVTASGNYLVDINNSGTNIVIKLTFSGTSFAGKATATIERLI
jgi:hypothetical protein